MALRRPGAQRSSSLSDSTAAARTSASGWAVYLYGTDQGGVEQAFIPPRPRAATLTHPSPPRCASYPLSTTPHLPAVPLTPSAPPLTLQLDSPVDQVERLVWPQPALGPPRGGRQRNQPGQHRETVRCGRWECETSEVWASVVGDMSSVLHSSPHYMRPSTPDECRQELRVERCQRRYTQRCTDVRAAVRGVPRGEETAKGGVDTGEAGGDAEGVKRVDPPSEARDNLGV